jgi:hypothetical protein
MAQLKRGKIQIGVIGVTGSEALIGANIIAAMRENKSVLVVSSELRATMKEIKPQFIIPELPVSFPSVTRAQRRKDNRKKKKGWQTKHTN